MDISVGIARLFSSADLLGVETESGLRVGGFWFLSLSVHGKMEGTAPSLAINDHFDMLMKRADFSCVSDLRDIFFSSLLMAASHCNLLLLSVGKGKNTVPVLFPLRS